MNSISTRFYHIRFPVYGLVLATVLSIVSLAAIDREEPFQTSRAAGIELSARFDNRADVRSGTTDRLVFSVTLDTHSTDLFAIDIEESAAVYLNGNRLVLADVQWDGDSENSHHRSGTLSVRVPPLPPGEERHGTLELRIRNVGRSDRVFEWVL